MKTIFLPISGRPQARNVLHSGILVRLQDDKSVKIVVLAPATKLAFYREQFRHANTFFESVDITRDSISWLDHLFHRLSLFYIYSPTAVYNRRKWLLTDRYQPGRYYFSRFLLWLFGRNYWLQAILRWLDQHFVLDNRLEYVYSKYKPDLLFVPKIVSAFDRAFLRQAKKTKVKTIGMISSWDNITLAKYPYRILPDKLVVYNQIIKREAIQYLRMSERNIFVSGWPAFDRYATTRRSTREEFFRRLGLEQQKRIILFVSNGVAGVTEWQVLTLLDRAIAEGKIAKDVVILVRHHPSHDMLRGKEGFSDKIKFDNSKTVFSDAAGSFSEILAKDTDHLADTLFHSDLTISTCSTMSIDAAVFDKPIINLAFDGWEKKKYYHSLASVYSTEYAHYQPIIKTGGVRIAYSFESLVSEINRYLQNSMLESEGRRKIVLQQCGVIDGQAGTRIGDFVLSEMK